MSKEIVKIQLDFNQGPIWISDVETGTPITGIDIVDNDEKLMKINFEISTLYIGEWELKKQKNKLKKYNINLKKVLADGKVQFVGVKKKDNYLGLLAKA